MLRIAISPCPNDVYLFAAWIRRLVPWEGPELQVAYHDIQTLNELGADANPPDVLKFSFAAWPRIRATHVLSDVGSALGRGVGPLVVARKMRDLRHYRELLIPGKGTTAALLCNRYIPTEIPVREMRYDHILAALTEDDSLAGVIIHESRFSYQRHGLSMLLDLGNCWETEMNIPLPLGGIGLHRDLGPGLRQKIEQTLRHSLDYAIKNPEKIMDLVKRHAQEMEHDIMERHIQLYVNDFTRSLGPKGRQAIDVLCGPSL